jgi:PIN domain nuclease of toxin-antitoxin system
MPEPSGYLLDTHVLIWALNAPGRLSPALRKVLADDDATVHYSPASLWEIAIKFGLGKLDLRGHTPEEFHEAVEASLFPPLVLDPGALASSHRLPRRHRDPFDRLLVWQAIRAGLVLLSADEALDAYAEDGLAVLR